MEAADFGGACPTTMDQQLPCARSPSPDRGDEGDLCNGTCTSCMLAAAHQNGRLTVRCRGFEQTLEARCSACQTQQSS